MKHIGHPLFNDARYGGDQILRGTPGGKYKQFVANCFAVCPRQAPMPVHWALCIPKPERKCFFGTRATRPDMTELIEKWRNYNQGSE